MDQTFCLTVIGLCVLWYSVGSSCSVINKIFLQEYAYPVTLAMISLLSISVYSIPLTQRLSAAHRPVTMSYRLKFMLPISIGKAIAVTFSQFSLWKVPVSYAHTVKATMPLFAVLTARVILGEKQTNRVYLSLVPIMVGVMIATLTELSFDVFGLLSALMSTLTYSLLNTLAKRIYHDTNMHPLTLLKDTAQVATLILFPFWCWTDGIKLYRDISDKVDIVDPTRPPLAGHFLYLLLASGALSFLQNLFAFTLIRKLTALSYAVANTTKRITVITVSLLTLRNPVTPMNVFGMILAILGVFGYNRAKQSAKVIEKVDLDSEGHILPRVLTRATLSDASFLTSYPFLANNSKQNAHFPTVSEENGIRMDADGDGLQAVVTHNDRLNIVTSQRKKVKFVGLNGDLQDV